MHTVDEAGKEIAFVECVARSVYRMGVAMGATAACLQHLGEIDPTLEFCMIERKQTQRDGFTVRKRARNSVDIVYADGTP